jgi:hypothetical protein
MFRSSTIFRELVLSLAKIMSKHLCPNNPYTSLILHSTQHTRHSQDMLPHHHITYKDIDV